MAKTKLTRYWHGGAPGLRMGDTLRPPAHLGSTPLAYSAATTMGWDYPAALTKVYLTTDKTLARSYAAKTMHAGGLGGDLYNVKPRGPLEADPDYREDLRISYACAAAKIVAVVERNVTLTLALDIYANQHHTWDGGGPMFARGGYALPSPQMLAVGLTADDLHVLGPAPPINEMEAFARAWLLENPHHPRNP